jgi:hypothetical protein
MSNQPPNPKANPEPENLSQEPAEQDPKQDQNLESILPSTAAHSGTGTIKVSG